MKSFSRKSCLLFFGILLFLQACVNEVHVTPAVTFTIEVNQKTKTPTTTSTTVPLGIFVMLSHPPLIISYDPFQWEDKSKYFDKNSVLNYLKAKELSACTIGIQDPAGYYEPYESAKVTLGNINYTIIYPDSVSSDYVLFLYLEDESLSGYRYDLYGLPVFGISSNSFEWEECKKLGEEVLATLRVP